MATVGDGLHCGNYKAAVDLSAKQFHVVAQGASGLTLPSAGGVAFGVLMDTPLSGQAGAVTFYGKTKAYVAGTVAAGDLLTPDAAGKLVKQTLSYQAPVARALEAGTTGAVVEIMFTGTDEALTGGTADSRDEEAFALSLPDIATGTVETWTATRSGRIVGIRASADDPPTTAAKAATIGVTIDGVAVTGAVLALTSANLAAAGSEVNGTAATAANDFVVGSVIRLVASAVTAFVEGTATVYLEIE